MCVLGITHSAMHNLTGTSVSLFIGICNGTIAGMTLHWHAIVINVYCHERF